MLLVYCAMHLSSSRFIHAGIYRNYVIFQNQKHCVSRLFDYQWLYYDYHHLACELLISFKDSNVKVHVHSYFSLET